MKSKTFSRPLRKSIFTIALCILVVASCREENELKEVLPPTINHANEAEVFNYIKELGFAESSIVSSGEYFVVEGDILFSKNRKIKSHSDHDKPNGRTGQAYEGGGLVSASEISNVSVSVHSNIPSGGSGDWRVEIIQAINDWNNIANTRINFTYLSSGTGDIVIAADGPPFGPIANDRVAQASFPVDGMPGTLIRINTDLFPNLTTAVKRRNMVHELGHCIGFRHTNWATHDTPPAAFNIPGTPCSDANSVMNANTGNQSWSGFSGPDMAAAQLVYRVDRPSGTGPLYRYVNLNNGEHFYTMSPNEVQCGMGSPLLAEGFEGFLFSSQAAGTAPIHRYYSSLHNDHFYTRFFTTYVNYVYEGVVGYGYSSQVAGTIPIYRYYNGSSGDHFYTMHNTSFPGYVSEGIGWYAVP